MPILYTGAGTSWLQLTASGDNSADLLPVDSSPTTPLSTRLPILLPHSEHWMALFAAASAPKIDTLRSISNGIHLSHNLVPEMRVPSRRLLSKCSTSFCQMTSERSSTESWKPHPKETTDAPPLSSGMGVIFHLHYTSTGSRALIVKEVEVGPDDELAG